MVVDAVKFVLNNWGKVAMKQKYVITTEVCTVTTPLMHPNMKLGFVNVSDCFPSIFNDSLYQMCKIEV